jgi:hypothetical protein
MGAGSLSPDLRGCPAGRTDSRQPQRKLPRELVDEGDLLPGQRVATRGTARYALWAA